MNISKVGSNKDAMWTLEKAIPVLREMEKIAAANGFHVGLTGSCLYRGHSAKDLDVVVYPHNVNSFDKKVLLQALDAAGFGNHYHVTPSCNDKHLVVVKHEGRRLDLFFLS